MLQGRGPIPSDEPLPPVPLEAKVRARAHEFSLPALLDVLHLLGYRSEDIEFRSHLSQSRASSLVESVEFLNGADGGRRVKIAMNLGLLSIQSPLPSYFLQIAERLEGEALVDFIGFFDHHLLKRRIMGLYPERDRTVFADWGQAQADLLQMTGLGAPSTLYWLFQRVFPELGVRVERSTAQKPLKADGAILGRAVLGEGCAFGGETSVPVGGIDIILYSEETRSPTGVPWPTEASRRLREQILTVLSKCDLYLTIILLMMEQENWLQMLDDRFLGHEPLWDPTRAPLPPPASAPAPPPGPLGKSPLAAPSKGPRRVAAPSAPAPPAAAAAPPPGVSQGVSPGAVAAQAPAPPKLRVQQVQLFSGLVRLAPELEKSDLKVAQASGAAIPHQDLDEYLVISEG
jgi:hypothetical protein